MTGPGGMMTDRDRRREARKQQYQQRQSQRQAQRRQAIRTQRIQRGSIIGGAVLILVLIGLLVAHTVTSGTTSAPKVIDGMHCVATPGSAEHLDTYVAVYANNQQQTIPTGIGIDTAAKCSYPLTVQPGQANVITAQSSTKANYTLGQFFDVWGQPLSTTQVAQHAVSSGGSLTIEVWDAQGNAATYHGDPRAIPLVNHQTIAILVNSPNAHPQPYNNWSSVTN